MRPILGVLFRLLLCFTAKVQGQERRTQDHERSYSDLTNRVA